jgi:hypothetical protein
MWSWDTSVDITMGHGVKGRGSISNLVKIFLFSAESRPSLGSNQIPIQWVSGKISPGVKRPGRETHHSHSSSAEVKNGGATPLLPNTSSRHSAPTCAEVKKIWIYTSTPPYAFMA